MHINAEQVGMASVRLGAGREKADDMLDYGAGIVLKKTVGDAVQKGEVIAELYGASAEKVPRRGKRAARGVPLRRRENRRMFTCTGKGRVK